MELLILILLSLLVLISIYLVYIVKEKNLFIKTVDNISRQKEDYQKLLEELIDGFDEELNPEDSFKFFKKYVRKVERKLERERKKNGRRKTEIDCY